MHRLNCAKANGRDLNHLFEPDAFDLIYHFSHGLPRLINKVCDHALFVGFVADASKITISIVQDAIRDIQFREDRKYEQIFQSA